ncbi:MAG: precorrin-6y C5,15-methyltransferase (decarboxylating) subunit CbiE, partial [Pseudomonadota bacterium]
MAQPAKAPWLTVVGCLPSGDLAPTAPQNALNAEAIFGSDRLLEAAGVGPERRRPWPKPFGDGIADLLTRRGRPTTVLASGDPLHHGVGATLLRHLPAPEVAVHPAPSAFALAAAELRWPLETATAISLHNSAPDDIRRHLAPAKRLIVLTRDGDAPAAIAAAATASGYGESPVAVLENLGGADARRTDATSATLSGPFAPLNVLAIDAQRRTPVVAADLEHDGCVTRDEIRALT